MFSIDSKRFIFFSFLKIGKLYFRLLDVASSAKYLKITFFVLPAVERRPFDVPERMMVMTLRYDAVELKFFG